MIVLATTGTRAHTERVNQHPERFGHLVTPRCSCPLRCTPGGPIGVDNDRFNDKYYSESKFLKTLQYVTSYAHRVRFAAAPDVVADAENTLREFEIWSPRIRNGFGLPVALVLQDGMTPDNVPWNELDAVFVGGSTEWKLGDNAADIIFEARLRNKWVHAGRVNSQKRVNHFRALQVDSIDGTTFSRFQRHSFGWYEVVSKKPVQLRAL